MPKAHRNNDSRACGAATVVQNQSTVFVNDQLWAVRNTFNNHGNGGLINSGTTVFIEDKPVIVHKPDVAMPDDKSHTNGSDETAEGSPDVFAYGD